MSVLETVDLEGVEILAAGGPVHGQGSAPGGDVWTPEQLRELAAANRELAAELKPPATIGHPSSDAPAVGWLENLRVNAAGDKLLADVRRVPRKFAQLVKSGGYRHRSVELSRVTSQRTGRRFEHAVTGLAWLGASLPAVRTLDDVVALYSDGGGVELRRVYVQDVAPELPDDPWLEAELGCHPDDVLLGAPGLRYSAGDDADTAERKRIAREYGLALEDVA